MPDDDASIEGPDAPLKLIYLLSSVRWNFTWQRHQSLAKAAAQAGYKVIFVEPHPRGLTHVTGLVLRRLRRDASAVHLDHPLPENVNLDPWRIKDLIPLVRTKRLKRLGQSHIYTVILHLPSKNFLRFLNRITPEMVIYDCVIDWEAAPSNWYPPSGWRNVENSLYSAARQGKVKLVSDSPRITERWRKRGLASTIVFPGIDDQFASHRWSSAPDDGALGYFGSVRYEEIDVERISRLAQRFPIIIVGPVDSRSKELLASTNVRLKNSMNLDNLVREIDTWKAIILPYRETPRTATLVPAKLWNALSTRRPVYYSNLSLPSDIQDLFTPLEEMERGLHNSTNKRAVSFEKATWNSRLRQIIGAVDDVK